MADLLEHEIRPARDDGHDVGEVANYVRALNLGIERLATLPISLRLLVTSKLRNSTAGFQLLDRLYQKPLVSVSEVAGIIGRTYPVANALMLDFQTLRLLREKTGRLRNRVFAYQPYLDIFGELKP